MIITTDNFAGQHCFLARLEFKTVSGKGLNAQGIIINIFVIIFNTIFISSLFCNISCFRFIRRNSEGRRGRGVRDDGEDQQHAGEDGEDGEGGDVMGRAEVGRLGGKCEEGEEGEESEGKSVEGGKWRRSGGGSEKKEEALTLDLTVTSPGEQPSPNPGRIFHSHFHKPRFSRPLDKIQLIIFGILVKICVEIFREIFHLQGSLPALAA